MTHASPDRTLYPRDPRVMPRPGDSVARGKVIRTVTRFQWSPFGKQWFVSYKTVGRGGSVHRNRTSLAYWQAWAKSASVARSAA